MDQNTLKKINDLAKSLKQNRLAANMEEAVEMAKGMLTKDPAGNPTEAETLKMMEHNLSEEKKELNTLIEDAKQLTEESKQHDKEHQEQSKQAHEHVKEFEELKKDISDTKEEVHAMQDIAKDAPEDAKKEEEAYESEEKAKEDLPGEEHEH